MIFGKTIAFLRRAGMNDAEVSREIEIEIRRFEDERTKRLDTDTGDPRMAKERELVRDYFRQNGHRPLFECEEELRDIIRICTSRTWEIAKESLVIEVNGAVVELNSDGVGVIQR